MFPNLIIAGAPKSGSSTLHLILGQHPEIIMSTPKEPKIFTNEWGMEQHYYQKFFPDYNGEQIVGESTVGYFIDHLALERMYKTSKDLKFIFILRNPVDQIYSNYWHWVRRGNEKRTWKEMLYGSKKHDLYRYSFYHNNILNYLKYFPIENLHFVIFEEFIQEPQENLNKILKFLNVNTEYKLSSQIWENKGSVIKMIPLVSIIKKLRSSAIFKSEVLKIFRPLGKYILRDLENKNKQSIESVKLSLEDRKYLEEAFYEDVKNLEKLLNRPISWFH